ncbi:MAG: hypothetical protein LBU58_00035 [Clostridiales bacterium]|jgi:hypothetical protein|nr:hypothetical protein [Clostridiales bacterium]
MFLLNSDRLRVEVAAPGEAPNNTCRFDRAGFVTEVTLDGAHRFCASEPHNLSHRCSGGRGICNEYSCKTADEAEVGGYFLKPGVGLFLKEADEPYRFFQAYQMRPLDVKVTRDTDSSLLFETPPSPCGGYALRQQKRLTVEGNRLTVTVALENAGDRAFETGEYCHNFLTINGMALGPDYHLSIPSLADLGSGALEGHLKAEGSGFTFSEYRAGPAMHHMERGAFALAERAPLLWSLSNPSEGASVHVEDHIRLGRATLWAADHIVSLETFHQISLQPGQSDTWTRVWTFEA